jgi:hypothetical protein
MLQLSQTHLNLLETCPRKFQHTYLEQLGGLATPEQQERLAAGSRFHLLMQQRELGLPVVPFVQEDDQLRRWYEAFEGAADRILNLSHEFDQTFRQSEHQRTLEFKIDEVMNAEQESYLLTVIYDLLLCDSQQARILDWKTYPRPQSARWLQQNWQTRLYPFVLVETSNYLPEQVSMMYWFFQAQGDSPSEPQSLHFPYNSRLHAQTRQDLHHLLSQLATWLQQYQQGKPFPQVPESSPQCESCNFVLRCQREQTTETEGKDRSYLMNVAEMQEVPI